MAKHPMSAFHPQTLAYCLFSNLPGLAIGTGAQPGWIGDVLDAVGLDVGQQGFGPGPVEPPLLVEVTEQVPASGRKNRRKSFPGWASAWR